MMCVSAGVCGCVGVFIVTTFHFNQLSIIIVSVIVLQY